MRQKDKKGLGYARSQKPGNGCNGWQRWGKPLPLVHTCKARARADPPSQPYLPSPLIHSPTAQQGTPTPLGLIQSTSPATSIRSWLRNVPAAHACLPIPQKPPGITNDRAVRSKWRAQKLNVSLNYCKSVHGSNACRRSSPGEVNALCTVTCFTPNIYTVWAIGIYKWIPSPD